jgi:hypothetical protein
MVGSTYAQNRNSGEIRGTVADASGAVIPDVAITIQNTLTGVITNVVSDSTGIYDAPLLPPGTYSVAFEKQGFKKLVKGDIILHVEAITVDASLEVGSETQEVTVTTGAQLVQTETSDKRLALVSETIMELPIIYHNPFDVTGLIPGAGPGGAGIFNISLERYSSLGFGEGVGINGQPGFQQNRLTDGGVDTVLNAGNSSSMELPSEAVGEMMINTSNFSAEYGNSLSVINMIQKAGTNRYHGEAYELVQNNIFNARSYFQVGKPPYHWNQFGGQVGGPIKKDKLFFFAHYHYQPTDLYSGLYGIAINTYPTAAMRAGDFTGLPPIYDPATTTLSSTGTYVRTPFTNNQISPSRFDPAAAAVQSYYPLPNLPGFTNNYYYANPSPRTDQVATGKVDYNISSGNRLDFSIDSPMAHITTPGPTYKEKIDSFYLWFFDTIGQLSDVWTVTPNTVNEFRVSWMRDYEVQTTPDRGLGWSSKLNIPNLTTDAFPTFSISGTAAPSGIGGSNNVPNIYATNGGAITDSLTLIRGKHVLKFGGDYELFQLNIGQPPLPATFSFDGLYTENPASPTGTGMGYADFLLGQTYSWTNSWSPGYGERGGSTQFFAQDDFKVTPKLTLNIGLRWTIQRGFGEHDNRVGSFDPTLINPATGTLGSMWFAPQNGRSALEATVWDGLEPRFGFAWAPKPNWSVRGGYGIFDFTWGGVQYGNGVALGDTISGSDVATNNLTPVFQLDQGHLPPSLIVQYPPSGSYYNGSSVPFTPYHTKLAYSEEWHLSVQHQFAGSTLFELGYIGSTSKHLIDATDFNQVPASAIAQYGAIGVNMQPYRPYPQYQSISYRAPDGWGNYNALQLTFKKAFSHGLWAMSSYTWGHCLDTDTQNAWIGTANVWQVSQDPRALYGNCDNDVAGIWNGGFVYQLPFGSGHSFLNQGGVLNAVAGGWQLSSNFQVISGEPFTPLWGGTNLDFALSGSWRPNRVCNGNTSNRSVSEWFDTSCFVQPAVGTFGNSGRNIIFGWPTKNMDLSLAKSFSLPFLGEAGKLQLRADARDVFNHPNFPQPSQYVTPPPTAAGTFSSAITNRIIQLEGKIIF